MNHNLSGMKTKRRDFLKLTGVAGLGFVSKAAVGHAAELPLTDPTDLAELNRKYQASHKQRFNMAGYAAPRISTVRVGIIGMGNRGPGHMDLLRRLDGVEIKALCDLRPERVEAAAKQLEKSRHTPVLYAGSENEWKKLCERKDLDLVVVTTPYYLHAPMAIYAMDQGKHVASEVPAAGTHGRMLAVGADGRKHQEAHDDARELRLPGVSAPDLEHGPAGVFSARSFTGSAPTTPARWTTISARPVTGTCGGCGSTPPGGAISTRLMALGPVCQIMNINRGDRLDFLVSVESKDFMMAKKARELAQSDAFYNEFAGKEYRGNMNTTLIRTVQGRTIMLQHDATSPSPHNLIHGIYGTEGAALFDPPPPRLAAGNHEWVSPEEFAALKKKYTPTLYKRMGELASQSGHWGSDLLIIGT